MMCRPGRVADIGIPRDEDVFESITSGRGALGHETRERRPDAKAFFDAGLEVGELFGFSVADGGGDGAGAVGGQDFGEEAGVDAGVGEEVEEDAADGGGRGVGAGHALRGDVISCRFVCQTEREGLGSLHLQKTLRFRFLLGQAMADKGPEHVVALDFLRSVSSLHRFFRYSEQSQLLLRCYEGDALPTPSLSPCPSYRGL